MSKELAKSRGGEVVETHPHRIDYAVPAVNIHQAKEGFLLEVELPGVPKGGVDLTVEEGKLIITGRRAGSAPAGAKALHREISDLDYRRIFDLDPSIDPDRITAEIDQGLLTVALPKAEAHKPRKISVG